MAWSNYQILLALTMVITGSINTLSTKWADRLESRGSDGKLRTFTHPFVQGCFMFFGELVCLITFKIILQILNKRQDESDQVNGLVRGNREFSPFVLMFPALCDMTATTMCYVGLTFTFASSFQMLRGSVIVFVGLLSVLFLGRRFAVRQWSGIFFIIFGLATVGASDFFSSDSTGDVYYPSNIVLGDVLIIIAQIITAIQMVYEEKFVTANDIPPLQAVGWEGVFGFLTLSLLLIPMYYIHVPSPFNNNAHGVIEDFPDAIAQIMDNKLLIIAISGTVSSIAFFNFAGISVTKEMSATTRMVLDSVRTLVIWIVSLLWGWQNFHYLQIIGFSSLLFGMSLYNNIVIPQLWRRIRELCTSEDNDMMSEPIINNSPNENANNV